MSASAVVCQQTASKEQYQPQPFVELSHPHWIKNATIYEVNIRQYTPQGTFNAFIEHLPRLQKLGVDILWLMPIHPIGEKNRKGTMGSAYSVKDYKAVNLDYGTLADLKYLVAQAHSLGMYVILDWVANHSAWDNVLTKTHPEWYSKDHKGNFQPTPWWDWSDIIDFDYSNAQMREYMTDAMKYWLEEVDIDGYRADVAGGVPTDFWDNVRRELDAIKPVFMLAEWDQRDLHRKAFDMTYAWSLHNVMEEVATGNKNVSTLFVYFANLLNSWPENAILMNFVDNHDKNAWDNTMFARFGDYLHVCIVLTATIEGMPLIYGSQEAGLDKSLAFFDKDQIIWQEHQIGTIYQQLFALKHNNQALWNGDWGGKMIPVIHDQPDAVFSFVREKEQDKVFVLLNFTDKVQKVNFVSDIQYGCYQELFSQAEVTFDLGSVDTIEAFGYRVYVKKS
ncbi:alpha-amylase family glycosyl hydrolase [Psychromonas antarctica]|uniref:alpha-amylase family glycosyl hydrolase n=1 Tax=Psychromonas antarctica TaxID=67573 RepID=UPI001EE98056|nr:alpha-amylase family glycosyl hydrolase [Psychromonas antarctica]MCG6200785.1 alpha-amylase [Psychromonas antarctica]